ncbi:MAG: DUF4129 domain-containing protein [Mycobacteriales bacterium]
MSTGSTQARRWWPVAAGVTALVLVLFASALGSTRLYGGVETTPATGLPRNGSPIASRGGAPPATDTGSSGTATAFYVLLALIGLVMAGGLLVALYRLVRVRRGLGIRRRPRTVARRPLTDDVADVDTAAEARILGSALDQARVDLDESDPRGAVIACWLRLERAAATVGAPRELADTPAELVAKVLARHDVPAATLRTLAGLYEHARFSAHPVGEADRDRAREALRQVADALAERVS